MEKERKQRRLWQRRGEQFFYATILLLLNLILIKFLFSFWGDAPEKRDSNETAACIDQDFDLQYGFNTMEFAVYEDILKPNQFIGEILNVAGIDYPRIVELEQKAKDVFQFNRVRSGKKYAIVHSNPCERPDFFIYEPDPYHYIICHLNDPVEVKKVKRPVQKKVEAASGYVESSLWNSMLDAKLSWELIGKMEEALAWTVDFYHVQKGDEFKLVYEQNYIDGEPVGIGRLLGAWYNSGGKEDFAIYYENENYNGFYDTEGRPTKRAYLKAPVKFYRISSGYTKKRFHPVLKRYRAHLGTDYAAPYGTPIYSVADGRVTKVSYTRGNGKYVKIRHDRQHETQYLHMSRFRKGLKPGMRVRQGEVIGYVGSTGLATGPHVCFRFWKNGRQINHRRLNFPPPDPLPDEELPAFKQRRDEVLEILKGIPMPNGDTRSKVFEEIAVAGSSHLQYHP